MWKGGRLSITPRSSSTRDRSIKPFLVLALSAFSLLLLCVLCVEDFDFLFRAFEKKKPGDDLPGQGGGDLKP
jgi:hypothetical protein